MGILILPPLVYAIINQSFGYLKGVGEMRFTKEMGILEALQKHPKARDIFIKHGMGCIACFAATAESIEMGAKAHGIDPDEIVKDLNELESIDE